MAADATIPANLLHSALAAAKAGAEVILKAHRSARRFEVSQKGQNDFVTAVDREAEAAIVSSLRARHPDHGIMAEESEATAGEGAIRWIIDPLDGTTNFIHGFPVFSVSIAAALARPGHPRPGDVLAGVVLDPMRGETFTAERGKGAFLDGRQVRVSGREELAACLLTTGFPFRAQHLFGAYQKIFADLHRATQGIRRAGSAALDLAYAAAGRCDVFFEFALSPWDVAAGSLLVTEAGGLCHDFEGGDRFFETGHIVAGTPIATQHVLDVIARRHPPRGAAAAP